MNHEWQGPLRPGEKPTEEGVDLSKIKIKISSDQEVLDVYNIEIEEIEDKEKWIVENKDRLEKDSESIKDAVKKGLLRDVNTESVRDFVLQNKKNERERIVGIKKLIEENMPAMLKEVSMRLGEFFPGWEAPLAFVNFKINRSADYMIDDFNNITADLGRLINKDDPIRDATQGMIHEISHIWINEYERVLNPNSLVALKEQARWRTLSEGIAVLLAGQDLRAFHEGKSRNYKEYITEAFSQMDVLLKSDDIEEMLKIREQGEKNMGYFYVVGYEMIRKIFEKNGLEKFREMLPEFRKNPNQFFEEYYKINAKRK